MGNTETGKDLRLWPGVAIVTVQWLLRFVVPAVMPEAMLVGVMGGLLGAVLVLLWWLFFSRAGWVDRIGAVALVVVGLFGTRPLLDVSIATGAQRMLFPLLALPVVSLGLVGAAALTRRMGAGPRRAVIAAAILAGFGMWILVKTLGFTGNFSNDLMWRWGATPEDKLVAAAAAEPVKMAPPPAPAPVAEIVGSTPVEAPKPVARVSWPGFRGADRDGVVRGERINPDWTAAPPKEMWRRAVGPGWSSFAVDGELIYTQEQRGEEEIVTCYQLRTGKPVWMHRDTARFWESNAGPGPRATPTLSGGRVYTLGGTGILNVLDGRTGAVVWTRNAVTDAGSAVPTWGIAASPLVTEQAVIVAASGTLAAYAPADGKLLWKGPDGGASYSSPRLLPGGQVLLVSAVGATSVSPEDGHVLWQHAWKGYPIVQPAVAGAGEILIAANESSGTRKLAVAQGADGWTVTERWTSNGLKPYFNDFVVHKGHAYGFDGAILACIDLADGKRKWKGGRYGQGQMLLLAEQDLLLILSEEGEMALVKATPEGYAELARRPAIEGKSWNHPVLAGDVLLLRNGEEMAAFQMGML